METVCYTAEILSPDIGDNEAIDGSLGAPRLAVPHLETITSHEASRCLTARLPILFFAALIYPPDAPDVYLGHLGDKCRCLLSLPVGRDRLGVRSAFFLAPSTFLDSVFINRLLGPSNAASENTQWFRIQWCRSLLFRGTEATGQLNTPSAPP